MNNEFEKAFIIMFGATLFILIISLFVAAMILPEANPSHEMNPFSIAKNWFMEDTNRLFTVVNWGVLITVIISIGSSFASKNREEKLKESEG